MWKFDEAKMVDGKEDEANDEEVEQEVEESHKKAQRLQWWRACELMRKYHFLLANGSHNANKIY